MIERYSGSFILAVAATFGLFAIMQALVATGHNAIGEPQKDVTIDIRPHIKEKPVKTIAEEPPAPPVVQQEPDTDWDHRVDIGDDGIVIETTPPVIIEEGTDYDTHIPDHDVLPLVRVQPIYPRSALERGIEGFVTMEFDISKTGSVENIRVVEAEPRGVFESAATKAIAKFRYAPRVLNGQALEQPGVQFRMTFKLNE